MSLMANHPTDHLVPEASTSAARPPTSTTAPTADPNPLNYGAILSYRDYFSSIACHLNNEDTHMLRLVSKSFLAAVNRFVPDVVDECWFKVTRPLNAPWDYISPAIVPADGGRVQLLLCHPCHKDIDPVDREV